MDSTKIKPPHKFFFRTLDNDLDSLYSYLEVKKSEIYDNSLNVPEEKFREMHDRGDSLPTMLGDYYNIFSWDNDAIQNLKSGLRDTIHEACEYYGIDFDIADYYICGWFNWNDGGSCYNVDDVTAHPEFFHDHMRGTGSPVFHGYYCVNAEPTKTFYHIDRNVNNLVANNNINNRLVVSET